MPKSSMAMRHAGRAQLTQGAEACLAVDHGGALGHLDGEPVRIERRAAHGVQDGGHHVGVSQLARAQVHRERERGAVAVAAVPVAQPPTGLADRPGAHLHDQAALLGHGKELVRREQSALGVLPADECLGADHLAGVEVHERLVEEPQLATLESVLKLLLDRQLLYGALAHRHVEQLGSRAAALLRAVHRRVGVLDQARGAHLVAGLGHRDADTGAEAQLGAARVHRLGELALKAVRDAHSLEHATDRLAQDGELVAAEAGHGVLWADRALDARRHLAEDLVAGGVAEAVVDALEAVDVEEVDGRGVAPAAAIDRVPEAVTEEGAVGQSGERVVERQALELGLHALAVGHVQEDAKEQRRLPVRVAADTVISSRIQTKRPSARLIRYSWTSASPDSAQSSSFEITRSASSG